MYNITKLWKKKTTYRMVTFPDETYGIECIKNKEKEYLDIWGTNWFSSPSAIKAHCRFETAKAAADQIQWIRQEFPDAVIKEY